ncbi:adenylyl-sulfate kinase [Streptomyces sp. NEAU-sy36]|uniref:adenylyl-sulfate kinase n=1 Tax=unclassified Streptomyces TaxID=2593676 RepID=UPI0015D65C91|nr:MULTISPECIES: adenylyl-sulfate kinase [unclassified Streptomyces]QLJ03410.1 adenylyl-sulfate kinase [Streptomyces sp. NEAU-sy36]
MATPDHVSTPAILREGGVFWVTGLAESGKTTVSKILAQQIRSFGIKPILLDGNAVREAIGETRSFDREGRRKMAYTYARISRMLANQGQVVICATISLFHDVHQWNRENIERYYEVFLDVPLEELKKRDSKGVYSEANDEEIVGIGVEPEFPESPDLQIANFSDIDPNAAASRILKECLTGASR